MSLRVRCKFCEHLLRVDESFAGARCRCRHCGAITDVPAIPKPLELTRPTRPARRARVKPSKADPTGPPSPLKKAIRTSWLSGSLVVVAAFAVLIWLRGSFEGADINAGTIGPLPVDRNRIARVPSHELLAKLDREFLGQPLTAKKIAWMIDGGSGMSPHYADVTTLVASAMATLGPEQQFGLVVASGETWISTALDTGPAAVESARKVMRDFHLSGESVLVDPFREIVQWRPDELFFVVAQATDQSARDEMIRQAKLAGVAVNVVYIGPYQGWGSLAFETSGHPLGLEPEELRWCVAQVLDLPLLPVSPESSRAQSEEHSELTARDSR